MPTTSVPRNPGIGAAKGQQMCVVCSPDHPSGLRIRYETTAEGAVSAKWSPSPAWAGFPGMIHGGVLSTVLDEAMSKAVASTGSEALTAELRIRFRQRGSPGERLVIRGWIIARKGRLFRAEASLATSEGSECAHAWAAFLALSDRTALTAARTPGCSTTAGDDLRRTVLLPGM